MSALQNVARRKRRRAAAAPRSNSMATPGPTKTTCVQDAATKGRAGSGSGRKASAAASSAVVSLDRRPAETRRATDQIAAPEDLRGAESILAADRGDLLEQLGEWQVANHHRRDGDRAGSLGAESDAHDFGRGHEISVAS